MVLKPIIAENADGANAMGRPVIPLKMTEEERKELNAWLCRRQMPAAEQ